MLAIRMQRTGRSGHATFRVVVQDSRQTPTSGKFVALLGSYDPHTKTSTLVKDKAEFYLTNGAQPSERVARLFQTEGITLPSWVKVDSTKAGAIRNVEKLRRNRPAEEKAPEVIAEPAADEAATETPVAEAAEPEATPEEITEVSEEAAVPADEPKQQ